MHSEAVTRTQLQGNGIPRRRLLGFVSLSVLLHLITLTAFVVIPDLSSSKRFSQSVVKVSLVSLPAGGEPAPVSRAPAPEAVQQKSPTVTAPKPPSASEKVSVAEPVRKKPKTSLKHKTFKAEKVLETEISSLAEKVEDERHPSIAGALERLKREVEQTETNPRVQPDEEQVAAADGRAGGRAAAGRGTATADEQQRVRIYQAEIAYQIQKNWAFSEQMAGSRTDLEAALGIKILADGEIDEIWFDQRSGNRHLDDSAYRAVVKSNPLPPLPRGLFEDHYIVGLKFGPKGLKRQ